MLSKEPAREKPTRDVPEKVSKDDVKVNKKLLQKFEKSDIILPSIDSEDEENTTRLLNVKERDSKDFSRPSTSSRGNKSNDQIFIKKHFRLDSKTESSFVETDQSVVVINKKVEEIKKKTTSNKGSKNSFKK
jgi:hypothetical protein